MSKSFKPKPMKKIIYILISIFFISSCTSIQDLVDRGDYDGAIFLAAKKLSGKKKRKTKHIVHLETAFSKVMDRDLNRIAYLENSGDNSKWDKIHSIYKNIQYRQDRIMPFLPLVSKDGYAANFKFIRVEDKLNGSAINAAEYHYGKALELMTYAREKDKYAARKAYVEFDKTENFIKNFKDVGILRHEAHELGQKRILIKMYNSADVIIPVRFEEEVLNINVMDYNDHWTKYYKREFDGLEIDYDVIMDIDLIEVGPEREKESHHIDTKEVEDGYDYVLDENGNVMKDTLGNDIKVPRKVTLIAHVTELSRHKEAFVEGSLICVDRKTGETIKSRPISVNAVFEDYFSIFKGNRRALCERTRGMIDGELLPFPNNYEITLMAAENLKRVMKGEIRNLI